MEMSFTYVAQSFYAVIHTLSSSTRNVLDSNLVLMISSRLKRDILSQIQRNSQQSFFQSCLNSQLVFAFPLVKQNGQKCDGWGHGSKIRF